MERGTSNQIDSTQSVDAEGNMQGPEFSDKFQKRYENEKN